MWRRVALVVVALCTGCIRDHLVSCGDLLCPAGFGCSNGVCVDPTGLAVPAGAIEFVSLPCGSTSELVVPIRNAGSTPIAYATSTSLGNVTVMPSGGTLAPDTALDLHVLAQAPSESVPGVTIEGSLIISTDQEIVERALRMTTTGAVVMTSVQNLDFGESGIPGSVERMFSLRNDGNVATDVAVTNPLGPYAIPFAPPTTLAATSEQTINVLFQPQVIGPYVSNIGFAFSGSQCQQPPTSLSLTGTASADSVLVDHLALDFGTATCGDAATMLPVVLTNNLGSSVMITPAISGAAAALFPAIGPAVVPAGPSGMLTLQVTRSAIPMGTQTGSRNATLTLDTPPMPKVITLTQKIVAPFVTIDSTTAMFDTAFIGSGSGSTCAGSGALHGTGATCQQVLVLTNSGNTTAAITVSPGSVPIPGGGSLTISPTSLQIPGNNGSAFITATLTPGTMPGSYGNDFTITTVAACSTPISLSTTATIR